MISLHPSVESDPLSFPTSSMLRVHTKFAAFNDSGTKSLDEGELILVTGRRHFGEGVCQVFLCQDGMLWFSMRSVLKLCCRPEV